MASAVSHVIVAAALGAALPDPRRSAGPVVMGALCSVVPDLDVIGFRLGIRYGYLLGHRGLTHSLLFAAVLAAVVTASVSEARRGPISRGTLGLYLFCATASHGVLDAMTNGGLGIAFFSPIDPTRYFFPFRPVEVSPIGLAAFFTLEGLSVLPSEIVWIWVPAVFLASLAVLVRRWVGVRVAIPARET